MPAGRPSAAMRAARCALVAVAVLVIAYVPIWISDVSPERVTHDPAALAELPVWTGAISLAGLMLWAVMVGACATAALVLDRTGAQRAEVAFFGSAAVLIALLAIDDAYQLHEDVLPYDVGVPQAAVYAVYLLTAVSWVWAFRRRLMAADIVTLGAAAGFLAVSVAADVLADTWLEDYAKLCGLCIGVAFWLGAASDALTEGQGRLVAD